DLGGPAAHPPEAQPHPPSRRTSTPQRDPAHVRLHPRSGVGEAGGPVGVAEVLVRTRQLGRDRPSGKARGECRTVAEVAGRASETGGAGIGPTHPTTPANGG